MKKPIIILFEIRLSKEPVQILSSGIKKLSLSLFFKDRFLFLNKFADFRSILFEKIKDGFREAAVAFYYFDKFAPRSGSPCLIVSKAISTSFKFVLFLIFLLSSLIAVKFVKRKRKWVRRQALSVNRQKARQTEAIYDRTRTKAWWARKLEEIYEL